MNRFRPLLTHLLYLSVVLIFMVPLWWAVVSSLRPLEKVFSDVFPFSLRAFVPTPITFEAYQAIFQNGFGEVLLNTIIVAGATVALGILVNGLAGFAFTVFDFPGKDVLFVLVLITFLLPFEAIAMPLYAVVRQFGWLDTYAALILPAVANGLAIFLFRQFFSQVPKELIEAAHMDGASWFTIFSRVYIPLSGPAVVSAGLMLFLFQWEAFLWPLLANPSQDIPIIQVGLATFQQQYTTFWNQLFAASVIAAVIPLLIILPLQKHYVDGLTGVGLKG